MNRLRTTSVFGWTILLLSMGTGIAAIVSVLFRALRELPALIASIETGADGSFIDGLYYVARSYLLRQSITNTLIVAGIVGGALFVLYLLLGRRTQISLHPWQAALFMTPLFLPVPVAALLWEPVFVPIDYTHTPAIGLLLIALVQLWRLWPLAFIARHLNGGLSWRRIAPAVSLIGVWLVLADAGTPLLITGGMPYGNTHLWATWAFTLLQMSLAPIGGIVAGILALVAACMGVGLWLLLRSAHREGYPMRERYAKRVQSNAAQVVIAGAVVVLPIAYTIVQIFASPISESVSGLLQTGYIGWLLWTLAAVLLSAAAASAIIFPARRVMQNGPEWLSGVALAVGMGAVPIWYLWLGPNQSSDAVALHAAAFVMATGISAGLIVLSLTGSSITRARNIAIASAATAALIGALQFPLDVLIAQRSDLYTVGAGLALTLSGDDYAQSIVQLAAAITFALVYGLMYALLRRQQSATATNAETGD